MASQVSTGVSIPHLDSRLWPIPPRKLIVAIAILNQIRIDIRRIDISQNNLRPDGFALLLSGLLTKRAGFRSKDPGWGVKELNLAMNDLDDVSLLRVLEYAKSDPCLQTVWMQGNEIEVSFHTAERYCHLIALHIFQSSRHICKRDMAHGS